MRMNKKNKRKRANDLLISCLLPNNRMMIRISCKVMRKSNRNSANTRDPRT